MALRIHMEDMAPHEVAVMYQHGQDAIIMVARDLPDDVRCAAVNDLLGTIQAKEVKPTPLARLLTSVA